MVCCQWLLENVQWFAFSSSDAAGTVGGKIQFNKLTASIYVLIVLISLSYG